jgi:hypothetical protein
LSVALSLLLFGTKSWRVLKILSQRTEKSLLRICTLQPPSLYLGSFLVRTWIEGPSIVYSGS